MRKHHNGLVGFYILLLPFLSFRPKSKTPGIENKDYSFPEPFLFSEMSFLPLLFSSLGKTDSQNFLLKLPPLLIACILNRE